VTQNKEERDHEPDTADRRDLAVVRRRRGYYAYNNWGPQGGIGIVGLVLIIVVVLFLFGRGRNL